MPGDVLQEDPDGPRTAGQPPGIYPGEAVHSDDGRSLAPEVHDLGNV